MRAMRTIRDRTASLVLLTGAAVITLPGCREAREAVPAAATTPYTMSESGLADLKYYEAFVDSAYDDGAGNQTIGYGHLITEGEVFPATITEPQATRLFKSDVKEIVDPSLQKVRVPLNQNQIDALGSFIFNTGPRAFERSVLPYINAGDFEQATAQMAQYTRGRNQRTGEKVVLRGLKKRRAKEIETFNTPVEGRAALVVASRRDGAARFRRTRGLHVQSHPHRDHGIARLRISGYRLQAAGRDAR